MAKERGLPPHSPVQPGNPLLLPLQRVETPSQPRRPGCTPCAASGRPCGVTRLTLCAPLGGKDKDVGWIGFVSGRIQVGK